VTLTVVSYRTDTRASVRVATVVREGLALGVPRPVHGFESLAGGQPNLGIAAADGQGWAGEPVAASAASFLYYLVSERVRCTSATSQIA